MKRFYYLNVVACNEFDDQTEIIDKSVRPFVFANVGLVIDIWPWDDLFTSWPEFFASYRLGVLINYWKFSGVKTTLVERISIGANFRDNYPERSPDRYFWMNIDGEVGQDDFALYNRGYMVVSEKALIFLRDNHVIHAEADEITVPFDEYFNSNRKDFWLDLKRKKREEPGYLHQKIDA